MEKKSIKNKVFASALALTLTIGAFQLPAYVSNADGTTAPKLMIKKVLNLPKDGVSTPNETFTFEFEKHSFNTKEDDTSKGKLPTIKDATAKIEKTMKDDMDAVAQGKQIVKLTDDVLKGVNFPEPGQYTYRVKEKKGTTNAMTYSSASYLISILTKTEGGKVVVISIQIKQENGDDGQSKTEGKTEYKPGTDDNGKDNNFVFNNHYDPKKGNNNPTGTDITEEDKKGFVLRKEVAGTNGNVNEKFKFNITAMKPEGSHSNEKTFKYKVVSNGIVGEEKTADYDKPFEVELKHGDRVVFGDVLLGSTVKAEETVDFGYQKSIKTGSKINGQDVTVDNLKTTGYAIGDNTSGNFVNFVNTQQTATGILMNNLPFIALVLVAGVGIFFFVKNKKEDENTQA